MTTRRRKPQGGRKRGGGGGGGKPKVFDLWRPVPLVPPPQSIRPASDPAALLRSLGPPPLPGQGAVSEHYLAAVAERAAGLAVALAAAGGLLDTGRTSDD